MVDDLLSQLIFQNFVYLFYYRINPKIENRIIQIIYLIYLLIN